SVRWKSWPITRLVNKIGSRMLPSGLAFSRHQAGTVGTSSKRAAARFFLPVGTQRCPALTQLHPYRAVRWLRCHYSALGLTHEDRATRLTQQNVSSCRQRGSA